MGVEPSRNAVASRPLTSGLLAVRLGMRRVDVELLAAAGHIPSVRKRGRLLFDERAVRAAIAAQRHARHGGPTQ